ncbi:ribosomal protein L36 [Candidozyma auris]
MARSWLLQRSPEKGRPFPRTKFVRSIVSEVSGLAPYERRLIELVGNAGERSKKLAKKRLGTHRALRKVEEMNQIIAESEDANLHTSYCNANN